MNERTHLQNRNNDDGCLHVRGAQEMAMISDPDLMPEMPLRKGCLLPPGVGLRSGNHQNHLGILKIQVSALHSKTKGMTISWRGPGDLHIFIKPRPWSSDK